MFHFEVLVKGAAQGDVQELRVAAESEEGQAPVESCPEEHSVSLIVHQARGSTVPVRLAVQAGVRSGLLLLPMRPVVTPGRSSVVPMGCTSR